MPLQKGSLPGASPIWSSSFFMSFSNFIVPPLSSQVSDSVGLRGQQGPEVLFLISIQVMLKVLVWNHTSETTNLSSTFYILEVC